MPKFKDIYKDTKKSKISLDKKDKILCAKYRKGHFEGVLDVMNKLTTLINPSKIFMGKKDLQQLYLVKNYLAKRFKTKIIGCKTIRDSKGIALSSRNYLLNEFELNKVGQLVKMIKKIKKNLWYKKNINKFLDIKKKEIQRKLMIKIEYFELRNIKNFHLSNNSKNSKIFIAYYVNKVRLIDNF